MADEELPAGAEAEAEAEDQDEAVVLASEITTDEKGNKTVSLGTMLRYKKDAKELRKRIQELEPIAARSQEIDQRLTQAQPIINAIVSNPRLRAEALRAVQGTRPSAETTDQPENDPEAEAMADALHLYQPDGMTLDVARAQRAMSVMDKRNSRYTQDALRPLAGVTLGQKADANLREAFAQVDAHGTPLATPESIREVAQQLPPHLLADPQVIDLVLNNAIGIDRRRGRTPKEPDEPLYLAAPASGRGSRDAALSAEDKAFAQKHGISEKDYLASTSKLAGIGRGGIVLGKD